MTDKKTRMLTSAGIAACVLFGYGDAFGAPTGGEVTGGAGTISQPNATTTRIDQTSNKLAIDWNTFDVAANEKVQFVQPSANAIAMNRILDQKASQIFGAIDANGRVFLINPNGVVFGRDSHINVAGLVASSLDMSSADFMDGHYSLEARDGTEGGLVANHGVIETTPGGFVVLTGGAVINDGVVLAELGSITLAAGHKATLDFQGDGMLLFEVDQGLAEKLAGVDAAVTNTGALIANGGRILLTAQAASDVYSRVVNNEGIVRANRIDNSGGQIRLVGEGGDTVNTGVIDASTGDAVSSGGSIEILGDRVGLFGESRVDASGATDGGSVIVGGDFQGGNSTVPNASQTVVGPNAQIIADAGASGDGGRVIVWSDESTIFAGSISARGGSTSGDGGFVETSSANYLTASGDVDASATGGVAGQWLLDPRNVELVSLGGDGSPGFDNNSPDTFTPTTNDSEADVDHIVTALNGGTSVTITTGTTGTQNGNITVTDAVNALTMTGAATLTLDAAGDIVVNNDITGAGAALGVTLIAGGDVDINAPVTTNGGAFNSSGVNFDNTTGAINSGAGDLTINHTGAVTIGANLTGNNIAITAGTTTTVGPYTVTADGNLTLTAVTNDLKNGASLVVDSGDDTVGATLTLRGKVKTTGTVTARGGNTLDDTFNGPNDQNTWQIDAGADNPGTLTTNGANDLAFSHFETLRGGNDKDTFKVSTAGSESTTFGSLQMIGAAGADSITFFQDATFENLVANAAGIDADGTPTTVDALDVVTGAGVGGSVTLDLKSTGDIRLSGHTIDFTDATLEVDSADAVAATLLLGATTTLNASNVTLTGHGVDDTLVGPNIAETWTVDGLNSGSLSGATFTGFARLAGGSANDSFKFDGTGAVTNIAGNGGNDTLDYSLLDATELPALVVNLTALAAADGSGSGNASRVTTFSGINAVTGRAVGTNALTGANVATTWTVTGANSGTVALTAGSPGSFAFAGFEAIAGGAAVDTFNLNGDIVANGGDGDDVFNQAGGTGAIAGENGNDTVTGPNAPTTWDVTSNNAGNVTSGGTTRAFTTIEIVQGGTAVDTFNLNGNIVAKGGAGNDAFNLTGGTGAIDGEGNGASPGDTVTAAGNFTVAGIGGGTAGGRTFSNIETLSGTGINTLTGPGSATTWNVTGTNAGNLTGGATIAFNGMETLQGGAAVDTFNLNGDIVANGGDGDDVFNQAGGTGAIAGENGNDTVTGPNAPTTWDVTSNNAGNVTSGGTTRAFTTIEIVQGGTAVDTFNLNGNIVAKGGAGNDAFNLTGGTGAIDGEGNGASPGDTVTAAGNFTVAGIGGGTAGGRTFSNIETLSGTGINTLTGPGSATTWNVTGTNAGNLTGGATIAFNGMETLQGGAAVDTFNLNGDIVANGGDGDDVFNQAGGTGAIAGENGNDTVTGPNAPTTWDVTSNNAGNVTSGGTTRAFTTIEIVQGGTAVDTFNLNGNIVAKGGAGNDAFNLTGGTGAIDGEGNGASPGDTVTAAGNFTVAGIGGGTAGGRTFSNIETLSGTGINTLTGPGSATTWNVTGTNAGNLTGGATIAFNGMETLQGGAAVDTFNLNGDIVANGGDGDDVFNQAGGTGAIAGENGNDTVTGPNAPTTWDVTSNNAGNVTSGGTTRAFTTIEIVQGGTAVDTFNLNGNIVAKGGNGDDQFNLTSGTGNITGEGGNDAVTGPDAATTWDVTSNNAGNVTSGGTTRAFNAMETVQGGTANDTFNLDGDIVANGGGGDDTFALTSGPGAIAGESGTDTVAAAGDFTVSGAGHGTAAGRTFDSMEILSGTGAVDTLTGPGTATTWTLTGLNGGNATGGATIAFDGMDALVSGGGADAFNLDPTFQGSMKIDGSLTSTMTISSTGSPGDDWIFHLYRTVDFAPGLVLNINTFSLTGIVTQAGTGTTPLVWTAGMDVTLGGTGTFFLGNNPPLPFTDVGNTLSPDVPVIVGIAKELVADAAARGANKASTTNTNAVEAVDWAQFDPNLRLFDVNNPGVKLPADQVVDELALFWFDDDDEDEIDIAQTLSPRTLIGLESRRN